MAYKLTKKQQAVILKNILENHASLLAFDSTGAIYKVSYNNQILLVAVDNSHQKILKCISDNNQFKSSDKTYKDLYYIKYLFKQYKKELDKIHKIQCNTLYCNKCKSNKLSLDLNTLKLTCLDCNNTVDLIPYGNIQLQLYTISSKLQFKQAIQFSKRLHSMMLTGNGDLDISTKKYQLKITLKNNTFNIENNLGQNISANKSDWIIVSNTGEYRIISDKDFKFLYNYTETIDSEETYIE